MLPRRKSPIETSRANSPARWLSSSGSDGSLIRASASGCLIHNQTTPRPAPIPGTYDRVAHPVAGADPPSKAAVPAPCPIGGVPAGSNGHSRSDHRYLRRLRNRQVAGGQRHRVLKLIVQPPGSIYAVWDIRGTQRYGRPKPQALSQVTRKKPTWITAVCKTVGSAYVGSNPTPATPWGNGPLAAETRPGGPFSSCHDLYQGVSLRVDAWHCPRTYSGQRPGKTSGAYNRSLCRSVPVLSLYTGARTDRLAGACRAFVRSGSPAFYSRWAAVWSCSYLRRGRLPDRRCHPIDAATEAATECASPAAGWKTCTVPCERRCWRIWTMHERGGPCRTGSRCSLRDSIWLSRRCTCRGLVMYLSCTCIWYLCDVPRTDLTDAMSIGPSPPVTGTRLGGVIQEIELFVEKTGRHGVVLKDCGAGSIT